MGNINRDDKGRYAKGIKIHKNCLYCGKTFQVNPCLANQKFCSQKCDNDYRVRAGSRRKRAQKPCAHCGKIIEERPQRLSIRKYCSYECSVEAKKTRVKRNCLFCGKEFYTTPSKIRHGKGIYCSHTCWVCAGGNAELVVRWQKEHCGETSPYWKGGKHASEARRRHTPRYRATRAAQERNKRAKTINVCNLCGQVMEKYHFQHHHQKPNSGLFKKGHTPFSRKYKAIESKPLIESQQLQYVPLNSPFEGSAGHHIDETYVIHIPNELHRSISHKLSKPESMIRINRIAIHYLNPAIMPILK